MQYKISVIIPTLMSQAITEICIRSFVHFCPSNIELFFIVVENSNDDSYKKNIVALHKNVLWVNNFDNKLIGSEANAVAIKTGLRLVSTDLLFLVHNDVCVTSTNFYKEMINKYEEGYKLIGVLSDAHPDRIDAVHVLGLMTETTMAKKINFMPRYHDGKQIMDVGDELTEYCRKNKINYHVFDNTYNVPTLKVDGKYSGLTLARTVDANNRVMFMHLGRGTSKTHGKYLKKNRMGIKEWIRFCNKILEESNEMV